MPCGLVGAPSWRYARLLSGKVGAGMGLSSADCTGEASLPPPSTLALEKPPHAQPAPAAPWSWAVGGGPWSRGGCQPQLLNQVHSSRICDRDLPRYQSLLTV